MKKPSRLSMIKGFTYFITIFFLLDLSSVAFAQDPEFTQFYANPLYLNPAFAGSVRCPRFVLNYRNQWPGLPFNKDPNSTGDNLPRQPYVYYSASYDQHVNALSGGLGLLVTNDNSASTLKVTNISGIYSYQLNISRKVSLKIGFQGTYAQKSLDWSKLTFGDMIDPKKGFVWNTGEQQGPSKVSYFDGSTGILVFSRKFFIGFAAQHLTEPNEGLIGESKLPRKYTGHMGLIIPTGKRGNETFISPNILYQQQKDFKQLNLGLYVNRGPIVGGLWARFGGKFGGVIDASTTPPTIIDNNKSIFNSDSFIALIGFQQGMYKFGYSYDITISKLKHSYGSHEISFALQLECKQKSQKFKTISCPSF